MSEGAVSVLSDSVGSSVSHSVTNGVYPITSESDQAFSKF